MAQKQALGRIGTQARALTIEDLSDKISVAVDMYQRAMNRYKAGRNATEDWETVIRLLDLQRQDLDTYLAVSHQNLGVVYMQQKQFAEAIPHFQVALKLNPDYALAAKNLAVAYQQQGEIPQANEMLALAKRLGAKTA